jgi:hypothetical protein
MGAHPNIFVPFVIPRWPVPSFRLRVCRPCPCICQVPE